MFFRKSFFSWLKPLKPSLPEVKPPVQVDPVEPVDTTPITVSENLNGKLHIILAAHCDGLSTCKDIPGWKAYALTQAAQFSAKKIPFCLEMTASEVKLINDPSWFTQMESLGCSFAAREPHETFSTAEDAYQALLSIGAHPTNHIGSYTLSTATKYINQRFEILTGGTSGPGAHDSNWSGFKYFSAPASSGKTIIEVGMGTANSIAIKAGIARDIFYMKRDWAVEVIRFNAVGLKGSTSHFVTPTIHIGETTEQAPKPILSEIDKVLSQIEAYGASGVVVFTTYSKVVDIARLAAQVTSYVIEKS